jgi:hypothetical protein
MRIRSPRSVAAALAVVVLLALVGAAPAMGAFSVSNVTVTPSTTTAGAHPNLTISTDFGADPTVASETPQVLTTHFGPGIIGNPQATPRCPVATFEASTPVSPCPANTVVGTSATSLFSVTLGIPGPTLSGVVFNLETDSPSQAAQLGVMTPTSPTTASHTRIPATLSPLDAGLDNTTADPLINNAGPPLGQVHITNLTITLLGALPGGGFFMTNPTSCIPVHVNATATSYGGVTSAASGGYTPTDCATEPFSSSVSTLLDTTRTDTPASIGVRVSVPGDENPRRNAHVLASTTVLPVGVTLNPSLGSVLQACTDAQFAATDLVHAATCPAASRIATATFVSPLFAQPFSGAVYYGSPESPGDFNRLLVDVPVPGIHLKLTGHTSVNSANGQITNLFDRQAQQPFTSFTLTFNGGPHSVFITPQACGAHTTTADQVPYTRLTSPTPPDSIVSDTFTTSFDGAGAACQTVFKPWMRTSLSNSTSGGTGSFTLHFERPDRNSRIQTATFNLTAGLVGNLALKGLTQCPLASAAKAACPSSSHVGHVSVQVGSGTQPATLPGDAFLTTPKVSGDPAGLSFVVPGKLGPVDVGTIIVGTRLQLRPNGGLTAITDPLPQLQGGVPAAIRAATVTIDRKDFMRFPTRCGSQRSTSTYAAVGGGSAEAVARLSLTGCGKLPFKPKLSAALGAKGATKPGKHPSLSTVLTQHSNEAAPRRVRVVLPPSLSANLRALNNACTQSAYNAGKCGSKAKAGTASATSSLVNGRLSGSAFFVKTSPGHLPNLVVQLRGPLSIDVTGRLSTGKNGQLATTFNPPDLPVLRFALSLRGGSGGILIVNRNLCTKALVARVESQGQNGKKTTQRVTMPVSGCPKPKHQH